MSLGKLKRRVYILFWCHSEWRQHLFTLKSCHSAGCIFMARSDTQCFPFIFSYSCDAHEYNITSLHFVHHWVQTVDGTPSGGPRCIVWCQYDIAFSSKRCDTPRDHTVNWSPSETGLKCGSLFFLQHWIVSGFFPFPSSPLILDALRQWAQCRARRGTYFHRLSEWEQEHVRLKGNRVHILEACVYQSVVEDILVFCLE